MELVKSRIGFVLVATVVILALDGAEALEEPLASGSFSVHTTVNVARTIHSGTYLESLARLHEQYSGRQERARLSYQLTRGDQAATTSVFYLDKSERSGAVIQFEPQSRTCSELSVDQICSLLNLNLDWWTLAAQSAPRHVVGPARLLFLVRKYRSQLRPFNITTTFHNVACKSYTLQLGSMNLYVHYSELELVRAASRADPILIQITQGFTRTELTFASLEPLKAPSLEPTSDDNWLQLVGTGGQHFQLDTFTFPPLTSCINALASPARKHQVFHQKQAEGRGPTRLSFDLNLKSQATGAKMIQENAPTEFELSGSLSYASQLDLMSFKEKTAYGLRWQLAHMSGGKLYQLLEPFDESEISCVATRVRQKPMEEPSFGRLLVGADYFVYLGEARVRGKLVQLFGTTNGSLPFWLEQSAEYINHSNKTKTGKGELRMRPPDMGNARSLLFLDPQTGSPVQLEIVQQFTKHSLEVFNFRWALDVNRPISEQFSLSQKCHSFPSSVAHVELVLEPPEGFQIDGNLSANQRNLALLVAVQQSLSLDPTTVFDLESKVMGRSKQILFVTFKVTQQNNRVMDVVYLGQGHANYNPISTLRFATRTFHICLQLAAQMGRNLYFGYNALERKCFIDKLHSVYGEDDQQLPETVTLNPREAMEMYRLNMTTDEKVYEKWAEESSRLSFKKHLLKLKLSLFDQRFTVSRAEIELGLERPQFSNLNSIEGVGLVKSSEGVRKVDASRNYERNLSPPIGKLGEPRDDERSVMTFEQCRAACLGSTWCASFSLCLLNFQFECLMAPYVFKSAQIRQLLVNATAKVVKVKLDDGRDGSLTVELVRHRNCELHNKDYLDMFGQMKFEPQPIDDRRRFLPVMNREQCAKLCVERNLEVLKQDQKSALSVATLLGANGGENQHLKQLSNVIDNHKANNRRLCRAFHYISAAKVRDEPAETFNSTKNQMEGFCSLGDLKNQDKGATENIGSMNQIESYPFRAELFFERRLGIRLLESQLSLDDKRHYKMISQRARLTTSDLEELDKAYLRLRNLVGSGDNFQNRIYAPELYCALNCVLQSLGPWPACRSFDLIKRENDASILCQLNSITLQQAIANKRQDLIDQNNSQTRQMWHYEPQPGYLFDELNFSAKLSLNSFEDTQINRWSFGWFSLMCLTVVAKLGGLALGLKMGHRLFRDKTNVADLNRKLDHFRLRTGNERAACV